MTNVGLRELRQDASGLVRRVEAGEEFTITVSGSARARLVPIQATRWGTWSQIEDIFDGTDDPDWASDRELVDQTPVAPWADE